ncbi:MAG: hypothetical protein RSA29_17025 [Clostridium sp.]|uniref:hypothetical protein n=1 Tax=Clostridium sp. TaxID=1506 RepID=UPI0030350A30
MGRTERRKQQKVMNKKLSTDQFSKLQSEVNKEYIDKEVDRQCNFFKNIFSDCLLEAFKKNGVSNQKGKAILDDVESIMIRKVNKVE